MQRHQFDENQPKGAMSLANLRNVLRGLHQIDLLPLRPSAKFILDDMEYSTDAAAAAIFSGTGVTVTKESTIIQEGTYSLKLVIDGTGNRTVTKTISINLSSFLSVMVWERCSATSSAFQFYVRDGSGNESYWDITSHGSANTWKQDTLTLASPNSNNGTNANLATIVSWGFRGLDASATYYIDTVKAVVGMKVSVEGSVSGSFYKNIYVGKQPLEVSQQASPTLTAPSGNPRIDILTINSAGTLAFVTGTEASSPVPAWASLSQNVIPIALVYCKTTMTKVLDYEDKDTDANQGYIYSDLRPWLVLSNLTSKGSDVASAGSITLGDGDFFDITGTTTITSIGAKHAGKVVWLQFDGALTLTDGSNLKLNGNFNTAAESLIQLVCDGTNWFEVSRSPTATTFIALTDAPSSYSGQALKLVRVNAGATALEFLADPFNTSTGHDHDGTDSKKVLVTNLDVTGITDGQALKRSGSTIAGFDPAKSQVFTANGSFIVPAGVTRIFITMCGGGGGGAGATSASPGSGGGAAQSIIRHCMVVTPGNSMTVTVGAGGAGGTSGANGSAGGNSTFVGDTSPSNYTLTCLGGNFGLFTGGPGAAQPAVTVLDASGITPGGVYTYGGGAGAAESGSNGGAGGSSMLGKGGASENGIVTNGALFPGGIGAGGGGAARYSSTGGVGGNGGGGVIIVEW